MNIEEIVEVSILYSYYKPLLSNKQNEYICKYIEDDFSIVEISKEYGISRQAVYDNIKKGIALLKKFEIKLGFVKRDENIKKAINEKLDNKIDIESIFTAY